MIEKFKEAALKKIEDARSQTLIDLVQLKSTTMQELGERHVMLKAKYEGLGLAVTMIEDAFDEAMGKEPEKETQEEGPYA